MSRARREPTLLLRFCSDISTGTLYTHLHQAWRENDWIFVCREIVGKQRKREKPPAYRSNLNSPCPAAGARESMASLRFWREHAKAISTNLTQTWNIKEVSVVFMSAAKSDFLVSQQTDNDLISLSSLVYKAWYLPDAGNGLTLTFFHVLLIADYTSFPISTSSRKILRLTLSVQLVHRLSDCARSLRHYIQ